MQSVLLHSSLLFKSNHDHLMVLLNPFFEDDFPFFHESPKHNSLSLIPGRHFRRLLLIFSTRQLATSCLFIHKVMISSLLFFISWKWCCSLVLCSLGNDIVHFLYFHGNDIIHFSWIFHDSLFVSMAFHTHITMLVFSSHFRRFYAFHNNTLLQYRNIYPKGLLTLT